MNNIFQNVVFPFVIKGDDFKELSLKAIQIKKWIDNNGNELAELVVGKKLRFYKNYK